MHDRLEEPEDGKTTLAGVKLHVRVGEDTVVTRVTVPANLFRPVTVMEEPP